MLRWFKVCVYAPHVIPSISTSYFLIGIITLAVIVKFMGDFRFLYKGKKKISSKICEYEFELIGVLDVNTTKERAH